MQQLPLRSILMFSNVWLVFLRLQVFVEFENAAQRCSWVQVYGNGVNALLVEDSIVWAQQSHGPPGPPAVAASSPAWPALVSEQSVHLDRFRGGAAWDK